MSFASRISAAVRAFRTGDFSNPFQQPATTAQLSGQWEGHERNRYRQRPVTRLVSQDTDLDYGNREKMIGEARALCQVFPIARALMRKFPFYCVGSCRAKWNTGDKAIDAIYEANWQQRMRQMDGGNAGRHFRKLARLVVKSRRRDGDVFAQKVLTDEDGILSPQIKLIEADRVNNGTLYGPDTENMVGGIKFTKAGVRTHYCVTDRDRYGNFKNPQLIPAKEILHIFDSDRVEAMRGVTEFDVCLNSLRDAKETVAAMAAKIKVNSKLTMFVATLSGGAPSRNINPSLDDTDLDGDQVKLQELNDGSIAYGFKDHAPQAHEANIPGDAWENFINFTVKMIARGHDLPVGMVWAMDGTGPAVRFDMTSADRVFREEFETLEERFLRPVCGWATSVDIATGRIPSHPNWDQYRFAGPVGATIDVGRDTNAGIKENESMLSSGTTWMDESGQDFEEETLLIADERAMQVAACIEAANRRLIPPELHHLVLPNRGTQPPPPEPEPEKEEGPQPPKPKKATWKKKEPVPA